MRKFVNNNKDSVELYFWAPYFMSKGKRLKYFLSKKNTSLVNIFLGIPKVPTLGIFHPGLATSLEIEIFQVIAILEAIYRSFIIFFLKRTFKKPIMTFHIS